MYKFGLVNTTKNINDKKPNKILRNLYSPLISKGAKFISTKRRAAELIKYAANAFLAQRVSSINALSTFNVFNGNCFKKMTVL